MLSKSDLALNDGMGDSVKLLVGKSEFLTPVILPHDFDALLLIECKPLLRVNGPFRVVLKGH